MNIGISAEMIGTAVGKKEIEAGHEVTIIRRLYK